jgi:RNA polymerase subunit RPABC4/transcription elongation factor Spt4
VAAADLEWERTKNPMFITDLERRAARQLGVEKPWLYDPKPMAECPACAEKIKPGVAVCRVCGAILDKEKAAQYGLSSRRSRRERPDASAEPNGVSVTDGAGKSSQEVESV